MDLADLYTGRLSIRRLGVLVRHLPTGSATWAQRHGIPEGWTLTDFLLADIFAALAGEEHPARPSTSRAANAARASDLVQRLREQRARMETDPDPSTS